MPYTIDDIDGATWTLQLNPNIKFTTHIKGGNEVWYNYVDSPQTQFRLSSIDNALHQMNGGSWIPSIPEDPQKKLLEICKRIESRHLKTKKASSITIKNPRDITSFNTTYDIEYVSNYRR